MADRMSLPLMNVTEKDKQEFEITRLKLRIKNLEDIVHELLRDRVPKDLADAWLTLEKHSFNSNGAYEGRGKNIAALMDRWSKDKMAWPEREPLK